MRTTSALLLGLLLPVLEAAAKEPTQSPGKGERRGTSGPAEISEKQRGPVLEQIVSKYQQLGAVIGDPEEHNRQMAAFLARLPGIGTSGYGVGSAWAVFTDGQLFVLDNSTRPAPESGSGEGARPLRKGRSVPARPLLATTPAAAPGSQRLGLPSTRKACLYATTDVEKGWMEPVEKALRAKKYDVVKDYSAEVETLKTMPKDCGVLVLNAHASDAAITVEKDFHWHYSIQTDTKATEANRARYRAELKTRRLAYYHPFYPTGDEMLRNLKAGNFSDFLGRRNFTDLIPNLALTELFVREYWQFPDNALVYMATCRSGADVAAAVREAVIDKNASLYVGWTGIFQGRNVGKFNAEYLFDRLLGANVLDDTPLEGGGEVKAKETPPQRAFPYEMLKLDMAREERRATGAPDSKYNTDRAHPHGWTEVVFKKGPGDVGLLAPSIEHLTMDEQAEKIALHGWFGADPGERDRKVTIGDSQDPLSECEWKPERIECHLDANKHGPVVAWSIGRPSNPVDLTQWKIGLEFTHSMKIRDVKHGGSIDGKGVTRATCFFRADVHEHRLKPGESPVKREAFEVYPAKNSTAEWKASNLRFHLGGLSGRGSGEGTVRTVAYVGSEVTAKEPGGSFLLCEGGLDPSRGFELSLRVRDEKKVNVSGGERADFVDMITNLGRPQDGPDLDAMIYKNLLRGTVVPLEFYQDDSFRIPGFDRRKVGTIKTYDENLGREIDAGEDVQELSCGGLDVSGPRAACVTPDSPPGKDAAR